MKSKFTRKRRGLKSVNLKKLFKRMKKGVSSAITKHSHSRNAIGTEMSFTKNSLPPSLRFTCRYSHTFGLSTGAAGVVGTPVLFRLASIFDPYQTGVGHRPYGVSQIQNFYAKYRVFGAKVRMLWSTAGGNYDVCCLYVINGSNGTLSPSGLTVDAVTEQNVASTVILSDAGNSRTVEQRWSGKIHKVEGMTRQQWANDPNSCALFSADPTYNPTIYLACGSYTGQSAQTVSCQITIEYDCVLYERVNLPQST